MQPRFQKLSLEELQILEQQFIQFLSAQSITADDWEKIKFNDHERADELIVMFSDLVYGSVMRDAVYLEKRTANRLYAYQCLTDRFVAVILEIDDDQMDLRTSDFNGSKIPDSRVYNSDKMYESEKEDEVFVLMQEGFEITNGKIFKLLCTML